MSVVTSNILNVKLYKSFFNYMCQALAVYGVHAKAKDNSK